MCVWVNLLHPITPTVTGADSSNNSKLQVDERLFFIYTPIGRVISIVVLLFTSWVATMISRKNTKYTYNIRCRVISVQLMLRISHERIVFVPLSNCSFLTFMLQILTHIEFTIVGVTHLTGRKSSNAAPSGTAMIIVVRNNHQPCTRVNLWVLSIVRRNMANSRMTTIWLSHCECTHLYIKNCKQKKVTAL